MAQQIDFKKFVEGFAKTELNRQLEDYKFAGRKAMKEIREGITAKWFGEYNQESMDEATVYNVRTNFFDNLTARITVHSYVDPSLYKEKPKAQAWVDKYGGDLDPREYVLRLQMTEGIIGLPKKARSYEERTGEKYDDGHSWKHGINQYFVRRKPALRDAVFNSPDWGKFGTRVSQIVGSKTSRKK